MAFPHRLACSLSETRRALLKAIGERYRAGTKDVKLRILDEFVAVTGYHRKHAIRLFNEDPREGVAARRPRLRLYDEAVREALVVLWEASDRLCGKRLKAVLPILVPALENHGRLTLDATVRGYRRLEGLIAAAALARLYAASRMFVNFFQPSFKLASKTRLGARVRKTYHAPETPHRRLLTSDAIPEEMKERLREVAAKLDPLSLLEEIRAVQHHLAGLAAGQTPHLPPCHDGSLDAFLKGLATAWKDGEVRATHRTVPRPARDWRTRRDPFERVRPRVLEWLEVGPDRVGKELFERLHSEQPGVFPDGQLRTFQRRVRDWRCAAAGRLVFAAVGTVTVENAPSSPGPPSPRPAV